jgi:predicted ArsR family transcriptional regulator
MGYVERKTMKPVRQKRIRTLLRSRPHGMTPMEISAELEIHPANVRTTLRAMPDVYVDRWRMGKRGQFEKVWAAVQVPEDCPHPKDRLKWGAFYKKPKTQWVIVKGAMQ